MSKNKQSSVAPKERINIKYVPNTGDQVAEIELPLNLLVVGDLKGVREETSIEERQVVSVNKNNFNSVMNEANISLSFNVPNRLEGDGKKTCRSPCRSRVLMISRLTMWRKKFQSSKKFWNYGKR